jgi:NAD(P)H-dependent FMN reductase
LSKHEVSGEIVRAVDHDIKPGVSSDEGEGDAWPELRRQIVDSNILIIGSPIWLGQPSSVAKRVLERMDAFLGETDDKGRMPSYGKVGMAAVGVDDKTWLHHLHAGAYSQWFRDAIKDDDLASEAVPIEQDHSLTAGESRARIRDIVERRYTAPAKSG